MSNFFVRFSHFHKIDIKNEKLNFHFDLKSNLTYNIQLCCSNSVLICSDFSVSCEDYNIDGKEWYHYFLCGYKVHTIVFYFLTSEVMN